MPQVLMIVESPAKAKKIKSFFPAFEIVATVGHFRDLPTNEMGVEPPDHQPLYVVSEGKQSVVVKLRAAAKKADVIYVASDPDREGEAIAAHVVNTLGSTYKNKIHRVTYDQVSKSAIEKAIAQKRQVDWRLVRAQEARRVIDRYVGYLVSPELTKKFRSLMASIGFLTAGRVQSVAVKLVVERQRAIDTFVPVEHYGVQAALIKAGIEFQATWVPANLKQDELLTDRILAIQVKQRTHTLRVHDINRKPSKVTAPTPLITSTYVQLMGATLKLTTKIAMDAAQKLFEAGLITYHRTDSPSMSEEFVASVRAFAGQHKLPLPQSPRTHKMKASAQGAHECLRVVDIALRDISEADIRDPLLQTVYDIIWMVTLQSQLADGENTVTTVTFHNGAGDVFVSKASLVKLNGWREAAMRFGRSSDMKVAAQELDEPEDSAEKPTVATLPELNLNESMTPLRVDLLTKYTTPPEVYTEKSLVKTLEKMGIGRPSTFASIIEKILKLNYVTRNKKLQFAPTVLGTAVVQALDPEFSFTAYRYTAEVEDSLDAIALGKAEYKAVVQSAWEVLFNELEVFKAKSLPEGVTLSGAEGLPAETKSTSSSRSDSRASGSATTSGKTRTQKPAPASTKASPGSACPECGSGKLQMKTIKSGPNAGKSFFGCTGYPKCKFFSWPNTAGVNHGHS